MEKKAGRARRLLVRKRRTLERFLFHLEALGSRMTLRETTAPRHAEALARAADPGIECSGLRS